jgi:aspartyl-tRNA(Asn)/glutamyl-tRNA(Gln) amidotransferase subunit B
VSARDDAPATAADHEAVIGLEIHVQLKTRTKMFCGCELSFGDPPNTHVCPTCLGLPGALPVVNGRAIEFAIRIGLALGCEIAPRSIFHRKNYFYPDSPKAYQISQYDVPLCLGGELGGVRLHRVHVEEDAAKLTHVGESGRIHGSDRSVVDFNRCGTPLVEIVTEPDLRSAADAHAFLTLLRVTLRQLGVSDVNMDEGSLRCDANVSIRPAGSTQLGTKTELKNMNSFRFLERGVNAEIERQRDLVGAGMPIVQETLHFDPASGRLTSLRSKEQAHDYRYFPEPDLPPILVTEAMIALATGELPELPAARAARFEAELGLQSGSARNLAFRKELADYFEAALATPGIKTDAVELSNWIPQLVERLDRDADPADSRVTPAALAALSAMVSSRQISRDAAREVLTLLVAEGGEPAVLVKREGLGALTEDDSEALAAIVDAAIVGDPDAAAKVAAGNAKAIGPLVGYVMRETKGRADGGEVREMILTRVADR